MKGEGVMAVPFHHGRGVFESVPVRGGRVWRQGWHEEAMQEAARALGLDEEAVRPGPSPEGDGVWRWMLDAGGFRTTWQAGLEPVPVGVEAGVSPLVVSATSWEARFKTYSYLLMVQARVLAGGGWAVLGNERGQVACATMANVFWVSKGRIWTPSRECGCRGGTVRRWVIEQGGEKVREVTALMGVLEEAEEIFFTNARVGILSVRVWRGREMATKRGDDLRRGWLRETGVG